jgi:CHAT domain-containing protein/Flp pilus assembly protein TadD
MPTNKQLISNLITIAIVLAIRLVGNVSPISAQSGNPLLEEDSKINAEALKLYSTGRYADAIPLAQRSLVIRETAFGPEHFAVASSLNHLGQLYGMQGRYADAEPLFKRALEIWQTTLGPNHLVVATSLNDLAFLYARQGRCADAEPLYKQALEIREKELGPSHSDVAVSLNNLAALYDNNGRCVDAETSYKLALNATVRNPNYLDYVESLNNIARIYLKQGRYADAEPLFKSALATWEKALGPNNPSVATALNNLALLYVKQGRYADVEPIYQRALAIREKTLGPNHPDVAVSLNNLASLYRNQGHYVDAEPLYQRALAIWENTLGPDHPDVGEALNNIAILYLKQGRFTDAEPLFKRGLAIWERALGADHPDVSEALNNLAVLYDKEGRYSYSEPLYKRSLAIREKTFGPDHPDVAQSLNNLAELYRVQRLYSKAEPLYQRSLAIWEKALGPSHPDIADALNNLAVLYVAEARYSDAEPLYRRSLAIWEKAFGANHPDVAASLNNLAMLYQRQKRYADAEPLFRRSLAIRENALGPDHPDIAESRNNLAAFYGQQGRYADAYASIQETFANKSSYKDPSLPIIIAAQRSQLLTPEQSFADSYSVLQFTSSSAASDAVQKLALRYAAGANELARLVRREQDLVAESESLEKALIAELSKDPEQRYTPNKDDMRERLSEIASERAQIVRELTQSFPNYVALSRPQPLTLKETQALLNDDEAVVVIDIGDKSYAWVVTKTSADWTEIPTSSKTLNDQIATMRQSLTFKVDKPFDARLAYQIYQQTLGPIANSFSDKKRISVIANGALTSIPLQLLVTKDPTGKAFRDVDWLVRSFAVTVIPSIYSLKTMRGQMPQSTASQPMTAYADPIFSKTARKDAQKVALRSMVNFYSGTQINIPALAETLEQLPSTKDEVTKIANTLNARAGDIHTGLEATEAAVKQAPLDQYRIIYFATHALVAGDLKAFAQAKAEPALALTIPDKPTDLDDGLLQATEVSELKLNADWVVLSACNTAASDGVGAEALSGLARAFFYAGARSLLVSHWDVLDEETAELMSDLFRISSENKSLSHGEALRQALLNMLNHAGNDDDAHPRVWAPFVVVGEPAKPNY